MTKQEKINELMERGTEQVIVKQSLAKKLSSGKRLKVKLGVDPTSPKMHLGHTVVLRKLKQFQELGHEVIFLVGDFTARIGDPSDKLSARKPLLEKEIAENIKTYKEQVGKVLDLSKTIFRHNSEWHKDMDFAELFNLTSKFTVNQMLERDMFQKRMKRKKPLWVHELLYPILQGYDSVALQADVELGGTDQTFNMLAARTIQPYYSQEPQDILTVQLLEGTDGKDKMSKSVGNVIDLEDSADEMFGKIMSLPDNLIIKYFSLLTDVTLAEISKYDKNIKQGANPRDYKAKLALEIVGMYHNKARATKAEAEFNRMFRDKKAPTDIPTFKLTKSGPFQIIDIIIETKLVSSKSAARRLVEQGAVSLEKKVIKGWESKVSLKAGMILKVGKRKFIKFIK